MKKLFKFIFIALLIILLFSNYNISNAVTKEINYTETLEIFDNPERGYYTPFYYNFQVEGNEEPKESKLEGNLIHLRLGIGAFSKKVNKQQDLELSEDMLNMLDNILKKIKSNGGTAIVRFAYDNFDGDEDLEPSLDMILKHIKQVCPILSENKDSISYIELGFFGPWGEMHSSEICKPENVSQAIDVMLENTPEELKIGVRQPKYYVNWANVEREKLNENVTTKGTPAYRIGLFNDGYLGSHSDLGTFENREIEIQWLEQQALHTLYGGEIVATRTSTGNEKIDTINTAEYMSKEAFRTHTTYLNSEYDDDVINAWKKESYSGTDTKYQGQDGYTYITNHLGYRFVLRYSDILNSTKEIVQNQKLDINLKIENVGFANVVNPKSVSIVLAKENVKYEIPTNIDVTKWNSTQISDININADLPADISTGNWDVFLRISKYGNMGEDNNYQCIRLANDNIWDETTGSNYIGNLSITEPSDEPNNSNTPDNQTTTEPSDESNNSNITNNNQTISESSNETNNVQKSNSSSITTYSTNTPTDNTIVKKIIPQTGYNNLEFIIPIISCSILSIILYKKSNI